MSHFRRGHPPRLVRTFSRFGAIGGAPRATAVVRRTVLTVLTVCTLSASLARAAPSAPPPRVAPAIAPSIRLDVVGCPGATAAEVRRIATIELHAGADGPEQADSTTLIGVRCEGDRATIEVRDPLTRKSLARAISLSPVASAARSRLLALAVAELVAASWVELEANPDPIPDAETPPPPPEARAAARAVIRERLRSQGAPALIPVPTLAGFRIGAFASARWFSAGLGPLLGVGVRAALVPSGGVAFDVDTLAEHRTSARATGSVASDLASLGATLRLRTAFARGSLSAGTGLRAGVARLKGSPFPTSSAVGGQVDGLWAAPVATFVASYPVVPRFVVELAVEAGYVFVPVRGVVVGGDDVKIDGAMIAFNLGAGFDL